MTEKALVPVEQREVGFYGDDLTAVLAEDGHVYASVRHMCQALGLAAAAQTRRINRHTVLSRGHKGVTVLVTPGGRQRMLMLRVDLVPLWLSGLRTASVKPELKEKLERYQEEAAKVLWEAFQEGRLTADPTFDELLQQDNDAVQAYKMALAVVKLAKNQILMQAQMDDYGRRIESIEAQLGDPGRHVTPEQASQISQVVKAVAMEMSKRSRRNEYGGVYGELYRKFGITSYKLLPVNRFEEAMEFLRDWHQSLVGDAPF